jgi:NADPH:quinone reductase-like Zn-dependent oxidoreductase
LIGTATLCDSLQCAKEAGVVCMAGMVGDEWSLNDFSPMDSIPTAVYLTTYAGGVREFISMPLQELVQQIADGSIHIQIAKVFHLEQVAEAHRLMESNEAGGKIVVLT